ncbi:MAG: hypothetical protein HDR26_04195 [Lachnospiraceae bacterium]|nr:hypothetical protein [Lachnospiraceae bacterium]
MEKGKLGIRLGFYGVLAFIMAYLGSYTALFILLAVVLMAEESEWASRQVIQAICLCVADSLLGIVLSVINSVRGSLMNTFDFLYRVPGIGNGWSLINSFLSHAINIVVLVFAILAIVNNVKGKDANVPLANKFAAWAFGKSAAAKPAQAQPQPQPQAAAGTAVCKGCGAPLNGNAFCSVCGKPADQQ